MVVFCIHSLFEADRVISPSKLDLGFRPALQSEPFRLMEHIISRVPISNSRTHTISRGRTQLTRGKTPVAASGLKA